MSSVIEQYNTIIQDLYPNEEDLPYYLKNDSRIDRDTILNDAQAGDIYLLNIKNGGEYGTYLDLITGEVPNREMIFHTSILSGYANNVYYTIEFDGIDSGKITPIQESEIEQFVKSVKGNPKREPRRESVYGMIGKHVHDLRSSGYLTKFDLTPKDKVFVAFEATNGTNIGSVSFIVKQKGKEPVFESFRVPQMEFNLPNSDFAIALNVLPKDTDVQYVTATDIELDRFHTLKRKTLYKENVDELMP